jgi:cysteine sulfinate desulfinase/cysteine desulfurase-like protein
MHLSPAVVRGGIRFSVSADTTDAEIEETVQALQAIIPQLRK